jgi:hypothetical protein
VQSGVNGTYSTRASIPPLPYTHPRPSQLPPSNTTAPELDTANDSSPVYASLSPSNLLPKRTPRQHNLALHFPPSSYTPEPTWIALSSSSDAESSITFQYVDAGAIFLPDLHPKVVYTGRSRVRNRDTKSMIKIWTLPAFPHSNTCMRTY